MKQIYYLLLTACCVLVFSCEEKEKTVSIPSNILPKEKMAQVIADIHIAEAEINLNSPPPLPEERRDTILKNPIGFENIFKKNQITKSQYDTSLSFYIAHPELLDTIYVQVLNELSKMQSAK